jgi:hypothetical protein
MGQIDNKILMKSEARPLLVVYSWVRANDDLLVAGLVRADVEGCALSQVQKRNAGLLGKEDLSDFNVRCLALTDV